jgi:5'-nucleotidase / UDP-sugar diphosphatase
MKRLFRLFSALMCFVMFLCTSQIIATAESSNKMVTILFTGDMHAHFLPSRVENAGSYIELGGYARLKSAIDSEKEVKPEALLLDAGDFSMGTLFQTIFTT